MNSEDSVYSALKIPNERIVLAIEHGIKLRSYNIDNIELGFNCSNFKCSECPLAKQDEMCDIFNLYLSKENIEFIEENYPEHLLKV